MSFFPASGQGPFILQPGEGKILNVPGGQLSTLKVRGEDTGGAYTVLQVTSPPAGGPPLHCHHREDEALYVLAGEYEVQCGTHTVRATPGALIFAPRDIPHAFRNVSTGPSQILVIASPAGIEKFFEEVSALAQGGPPDITRVREIAATYDIDLLLSEGTS